MDWLECAAKRQNAAGRVKADPLTIAEDIGSDEVTVCHVVSHLVQKQWLMSYESDGDLFKATIGWFEADQRRGDDAERKAANRAVSDSLSRSVTVSPLREEKSREEIKEKKERAPRERSGKVDQTSPPTNFPEPLLPKLSIVVTILKDGWQHRGGIEPQPRGVGLAMLRDQAVDHEAVARKLVQWLTSGNGQSAPCKDIASYFGNWVEREPASSKPQLRVVNNAQPTVPGKYTQAAKNNPYSVIPEAS
jgi:hypothetical protein